MGQPLFVFENIETTPRRRLFRFLGVDWYATPLAWLQIPLFLINGIVIAMIWHWGAPISQRVTYGLIYGVLLMVLNTLHTIGHIISGKIVGAPMDGVLVTMTRQPNLYNGDQSQYSSRVHIGRSLGGPVMNILLAGVSAVMWVITDSPIWQINIWQMFGLLNGVVGFNALLPFPSVDGEVIWREMLRKRPAGTPASD